MLWVLIRIASNGLAEAILMSTHIPQHMFLWRNNKNYPWIIIKYPSYLFYWNLAGNRAFYGSAGNGRSHSRQMRPNIGLGDEILPLRSPK